jgi:hypothetical protein
MFSELPATFIYIKMSPEIPKERDRGGHSATKKKAKSLSSLSLSLSLSDM